MFAQILFALKAAQFNIHVITYLGLKNTIIYNLLIYLVLHFFKSSKEQKQLSVVDQEGVA